MTCNHDGSVITCDTGFGPSADGMFCNPGVSNCATLNAGSVAICDLCQTPFYFWDGLDCLDCWTDLDPDCLVVTHAGVITSCGNGEYPSILGLTCEPPAANC